MKRPAIRLLPLVAAIAEAMPPPPTPGEMDSPISVPIRHRLQFP